MGTEGDEDEDESPSGASSTPLWEEECEGIGVPHRVTYP